MDLAAVNTQIKTLNSKGEEEIDLDEAEALQLDLKSQSQDQQSLQKNKQVLQLNKIEVMDTSDKPPLTATVTKQMEDGNEGGISCREMKKERSLRWRESTKHVWPCSLCPPNDNQLYLDRYNASTTVGETRKTLLARHVSDKHPLCEHVEMANGKELWIDRQRATWWSTGKKKNLRPK